MEFRKDTLEPLYKLHIGRSGDSNALYISKKMGISESIIEKSKKYIETKEYNYELIKDDKISKEKEEIVSEVECVYEPGDKVLLLDKNLSAIVYKGIDKFNNITVFLNKEFIEVNYKRIKLEFKAKELYPEGYDLNQIFTSFKERKLERDIIRGSKKGLKKYRKEQGL
jgi:dsDNA-specific endonuclease/ATPase MutS2